MTLFALRALGVAAGVCLALALLRAGRATGRQTLASEPAARLAPPADEVRSVMGAAPAIPVMAAHDDMLDGPRHPHPTTAEHRRIFRENRLIWAINGAMDRGDVAAMRELNGSYKAEFPKDSYSLQAAYALIADCLEQHTPDNRERAQRYFDEERGSTLRRYISRHCLEP